MAALRDYAMYGWNSWRIVGFAAIGVSFILPQYGPVQAATTERASLERFYIVAEAISDASPFWYKYILDVTPEAKGATVRWIRVAPLSDFCSTPVTIKAVSAQLSNSVAEFAGKPNLCVLTSQKVAGSLKRFRRSTWLNDTVRFTIVSQCGMAENVIYLPYEKEIDLDGLRKSRPGTAALFDLYQNIVKRAFGERSVFYEISSQQDAELQQLGRSLIGELESGRFDLGFRDEKLKEILKQYRGSVSQPQLIPRLITPPRSSFVRYLDPSYPPLAKQARIQGSVEIELIFDPGTGRVQDLRAVSGHPLLRDSALAAAKQWEFNTGAKEFGRVMKVTLDYTLDCHD